MMKPAATEPPPLRFLTQWEFGYVDAMAETIWPTDADGPGARPAGVGYYIDGQLAGSWGKGHRFYLNGPFYPTVDTGHGWQIPMTPAEVYRAFLPAFEDRVPFVTALFTATSAERKTEIRLTLEVRSRRRNARPRRAG